ncbi:HNH endonuclease [Candidatus Methanomassiliicoccus intestinalis]|jgi:hypothetical protein
MMPDFCLHRLDPLRESHCGLLDDDGTYKMTKETGMPIFCTKEVLRKCPYRNGEIRTLEFCPYCKKRHYAGSGEQKLCKEKHNVNEAFTELRKEFSQPPKYYPDGTRKPIYSDWTEDWIRVYLWRNIRQRILRRDKYTCQDCGAEFGKSSRKVYDPSLRHGKGGYKKESLEVHHIIPRSLGGSDHPGNLKTLCPDCHKKYGELHRTRCKHICYEDEDFIDPWE